MSLNFGPTSLCQLAIGVDLVLDAVVVSWWIEYRLVVELISKSLGGRLLLIFIIFTQIYPESEDVRDRDERLGRPALNAYDITYIYPTSLPSIHEQFRFCQAAREAREGKRTGVSAEDMLRPVAEPQSMYQGKQSSHDRGSKQAHELSRASSSTSIAYNKNYELYYSRCHPIRELGLAVPPPRLVQPSELAKRKMEIFRMPDGEDELVEVPRGIIARKFLIG